MILPFLAVVGSRQGDILQKLQVHHKATSRQTTIHSVHNSLHLYVFTLWEEAGEPDEKLCRYNNC